MLSLIPAGAVLDGVEGIQDKRPGISHVWFWQIEADYCVYVPLQRVFRPRPVAGR